MTLFDVLTHTGRLQTSGVAPEINKEECCTRLMHTLEGVAVEGIQIVPYDCDEGAACRHIHSIGLGGGKGICTHTH